MTSDLDIKVAANTALGNLLDRSVATHRAGVGLLPSCLTHDCGQVLAEVGAAFAEYRTRHMTPVTGTVPAHPTNAGRAVGVC